MSLSYRELVRGLRSLGLNRGAPVVAHASLSAFGEVHGGAETLLAAVLETCGRMMMPTFTYKTMVIPPLGPENNGLAYGSGDDLNRMAEFFTPDMPADPLMGILPEMLRQHPQASRSTHPILSFAGVGVDAALAAQSTAEPLAPLAALAAEGGLVLLLGVNHTASTTIHLGEALAGRRSFVRWALTPEGVRECPGFPGCSDGFEALAAHLDGAVRSARLGLATVQVMPMAAVLEAVKAALAADAQALLCQREVCERCDAVRGTAA
ncbi:MAG TPA: AAC(3) family N-acetyltransferase [Anaerolineaceae bacterium]|nr:AAC(3) family N-acetyltransferase [Anaerolineaceae bacterium]HPN50502.1 AAC(3) family N-acetyltransferase [Anaerolineaceae bacterium]